MAIATLDVEITAIGGQGDGLAQTDAGLLYVPLTVPGDVARVIPEAKKGEGQAARLVDIIRSSADRREPACRHFGACGGCTLQHLSDGIYVEFKRGRIVEALARRGLQGVPVAAPILVPPGTRRRTRFSARTGNGGVILGYSQRASHRLEDVYQCPVLAPALEALLTALRTALEPMLTDQGPMQISAVETDSGTDLVFEAKDEPGLDIRRELADFAESADLARLSWSADGFTETIVQRRVPVIRFGDHHVALPAGAFLQASKEAEEWMAQFAQDHINTGPTADLFAGLGTFSFRLADKASVTAFETDAGMVDALRQGARSNRLDKLRAERRDLFRDPVTPMELGGYEAVVIDPPRAGAKAQSKELAESTVPLIVAFSCNPNTFARDARILVDGGYQLDLVVPIDQFRWSAHVELAAVFRR